MIFRNSSSQIKCSNKSWTTYCNFDIAIIVYNIAVNDRIETHTIVFDIMSTTTNFKMLKISSMFFTKLTQRRQNLSCETIKRRILMSVTSQRTSHQRQIRAHSSSCWFRLIFSLFSIFCIDVIVFTLFTVRIYNAWKTESCQKHLQKLLFDFIERLLWMQINNKLFETRIHASRLTRFSTRFSNAD